MTEWLAYETRGRGEPLVLIHGLATTRAIWRRVIPLLARAHEVTAIDVPGFGESPPVGPGFELDAVADDIAAGLEGLGRFDLVGHSMGGAVAIALAERHPDAVRRLVLVAPAGLRPLPSAAARFVGVAAARAIPLRRRGAALADMAWGRRLLMSPGTVDPSSIPPAEVRAMLEASRGATRIAAALESAASADLRERLAQLEVPVGAIWGAGDRIIPSGGIETLREARPGGAIAEIAGTGHIPMMEAPERFAEKLEQVLRALSPDGNIAHEITD
jgi:pimeloyl-ACP methyl ester carboxylesterase